MSQENQQVGVNGSQKLDVLEDRVNGQVVHSAQLLKLFEGQIR